MTILGKTIVAILILGGVSGGVYYAANFMKEDAESVTETSDNKEAVTPQNEAPVEEEGKTFTEKDFSFKDLMGKVGSYECTVKQSVNGITSEGKVYIKGENISATFSSQVAGQTFTTSMITKDGYSYTWSSMAPQNGVKVKITTPATTATDTPTSASYAWDGKDIGSYSCTVKAIPGSVFEIPSAVTFTEVKQ